MILDIVSELFEPGRATDATVAYTRFRKLAVPYQHEQARAMFRQGVDMKTISAATGTTLNVLYGAARRHRWSSTDTPTVDEEICARIRTVFAHPQRVTPESWQGWITDAVAAGLLVNAGSGRYTRRVATQAA